MVDCPVFGFGANKAASGKTKLGKMPATVATGGEPPTMSMSSNDNENAKKFFAALDTGATVMFIDNVPRGTPVDNDILNQMITSPNYTDRRLCTGEMGTVSTRVLFIFTGNDLTLAGDLVSRAVLCTVNPPSSEPETLKYDFDPAEVVQRSREQFVADCLIILRAYIHAGRPGEDQLTAFRLKGYNLLRGALVWLGMPDPALSQKDNRDDSPEMVERFRLLEVLVRYYRPQQEFRAWTVAEEPDALKLLGNIGQSDPVKRIGRMLSRHKDCEMCGVVIKARKNGPSGLTWWWEGTPDSLLVDAWHRQLGDEAARDADIAHQVAEARKREKSPRTSSACH
jgi:hypothetical protein